MKKRFKCLSAILAVSLAVASSAAAIPAKEKVLASDGAAGDHFGGLSGNGVAIDGDYAIVGADGADPGGESSGAAYIYHYNGTNWAEQQKLTAGDGAASDNFGYSVSISGSNAIAGANNGDGNVADTGAAYVFHFDGSSWSQQQKLTASDGDLDDRFGASVAISGDYAIVGAYAADSDISATGAAYVYHFNGTGWVQQQKLVAGDRAADDNFGYSVAISGNYAVIGAHLNDDNGSASGAAYIFHFNGTSWVEEQKLLPGDAAADDMFGVAVSVSGNNALVGATGTDGHDTDSGGAYVFFNDGSSWTEQQKLKPIEGYSGDLYGNSVSISGDNAIVGGFHDFAMPHIYHHNGLLWVTTDASMPEFWSQYDLYGRSVSLSANKIVVGVPGDDDNGSESGSAETIIDFRTDPIYGDFDQDGYPYAEDCNDNIPTIYPGALEVCDDGMDSDCDGLTDPSDPDCPPDVDVDGDGWGSMYDCDDNDEWVHPNGWENSRWACTDGKDNDCDGLTDLEEPECSVDNDEDGYPYATDCQDTNAAINPGETELCDGFDNNCNSLTDDADPGVVGQTTWYADADTDFYGNVGASQTSCNQPGGYVVDSTDCNDGNAGVNPGEAENCSDGIDNDCDFLADGNDPDCICTVTESPEVSCSDGIDNDCNGKIDCADRRNCKNDPACN